MDDTIDREREPGPARAVITTGRTVAVVLLGLTVLAAVVGVIPPVAADGAGETATGAERLQSQGADASVESGSVRWVGQRLSFEGAQTDSVYEIRRTYSASGGQRVGELVRQFQTDADGSELLKTESLSRGSYVVVDSSGDVVRTDQNGNEVGTGDRSNRSAVAAAAFELNRQELSASFADDPLLNGRETTLEVDSNRAAFQVELTAQGLTSRELTDIFGGTRTDDGTRVRVEDGEIDADFSRIDAGEYVVRLNVRDTTATARARIRVGQSSRARLSFTPQVVDVARGGVATFQLDLRGTDVATVVVGSEDMNYETAVAVEDRNDDGRVRLEMNTYLAGGHEGGSEREAWSTTGRDRITSVERRTERLSRPLAAGQYDLSGQVGGDERAVGTLSVAQPSASGLQIETAPGAQFTDRFERLTRTPTNRIALDDVIVVGIRGSGLVGAIEAQSGGTTAEKFRRLVGSDTASFTLDQENPEANRGRRNRLRLDVPATVDNRGMRVVTDATAGTVYVLLDETRTRFEGYRSQASARDRFEMRFTLDKRSGLTRRNQTITDTLRLAERTVSFETNRNGQVRVRARPNTVLSGTTTVAPGTELSFTLRGSGRGVFYRQTTAVVAPDRTFTSQVDLGGVDPDTNFTVLARGFGVVAEGVVGPTADSPVPTATPTPEPTTVPPTTAVTTESTTTAPTETEAPTTAPTTVPGTAAGTPSPTAGSGPGFGVVVAVVALLGVGLWARRRR